VNPSYPREAERQHVDGSVLLHINIDKDGNVSNIEPTSYPPSHPHTATDLPTGDKLPGFERARLKPSPFKTRSS
jgi:Gram-negative bacterial TonB protein C-terminal